MRGVIYYNCGEKCMVRILVSMYTLRKHYKGPVTLMTEGPQPDWFLRSFRKMGGAVKEMICLDKVPPLVRKAQLWEYSPYDTTMFLDADTVVIAPIDEYFHKIEEHSFCTGEFAGWKSDGNKISGRIKGFSKVCTDLEIKEALAYGKATNTGIFGFTKDAKILQEWKEIALKGWQHECSRIPDEVGCQILLPKYEHWLAPVEWGVSVKFGEDPDLSNIKIVHYHGRKHADDYKLCSIWKWNFWEFYWSIADKETKKHLLKTHGDRKLKRYLTNLERDVTVVTAVDKNYYSKFKENYKTWMKTEGVCEHKIIVFVHGFKLSASELDFMRDRVELVQWDLKGAASQRERMLNSFILGIPKHVKTKWWIKLDGDTHPVNKKGYGYRLEYPDGWKDNVVTWHKWGYTKPGSFLVDLEEWADTKINDNSSLFYCTERVFPPNATGDMLNMKRYPHKRGASFIAIQDTEFTNQIAKEAGDKLPVPSHDTYFWYCAERLKKPMLRTNWKAQGFSSRS